LILQIILLLEAIMGQHTKQTIGKTKNKIHQNKRKA